MSMLIFGVVSLLGLMFLSGALVAWLCELTGDVMVSLLIVGLMYVVVAASLYFGSIHRTLRTWQRRLDTVYDVSAMFEVLYSKVMAYVQKILGGI
ncbi:MAG: hypothetical protein IIX19_01505 [Alistipes sp.]|nr:hypothetical protein [Alistipes sp.]